MVQGIKNTLSTPEVMNSLKEALPPHISVEKFRSVALSALTNNKKLTTVDRNSFFIACKNAAQDGLLPDGREGAIIPYGNTAQWQPMVAGIKKLVRNSGEITSWIIEEVKENDEFDYGLGDSPFIKHKPALSNRGNSIAFYSVATLKSGEKSIAFMNKEDIEVVRKKCSNPKSDAWDKWYDEMGKKTIAKRHAKNLPMSTDLARVIDRVDQMYDFSTSAPRQETAKEVSAGDDVLNELAIDAGVSDEKI